MALVRLPDEVRKYVRAARKSGRSIAVVPTMGALHAGHRSLIEAARAECDFVVVTIFVNPTQFGPNEDFGRYPRTLDADLAMCRDIRADLVYAPDQKTVYPDGFSTFVEVAGLSESWEGRFRPGHFRGVTTVVLKLFATVQPDVAYFGRKDYQQQLLIRRMCRDLDLPVRIRTCPIVREADGLALSSRNRYLDPQQRRAALALSQALQSARERIRGGEQDVEAVRRAMRDQLAATPGVDIDYATIVHPDTLEEPASPLPEMVALVAARVGGTRLIDNMAIDARP